MSRRAYVARTADPGSKVSPSIGSVGSAAEPGRDDTLPAFARSKRARSQIRCFSGAPPRQGRHTNENTSRQHARRRPPGRRRAYLGSRGGVGGARLPCRAVHDDRQAAFGGDPRRLPVDHAQLQPQRAGSDNDRLAGRLLVSSGLRKTSTSYAAAQGRRRLGQGSTAAMPSISVSFGFTGTPGSPLRGASERRRSRAASGSTTRRRRRSAVRFEEARRSARRREGSAGGKDRDGPSVTSRSLWLGRGARGRGRGSARRRRRGPGGSILERGNQPIELRLEAAGASAWKSLSVDSAGREVVYGLERERPSGPTARIVAVTATSYGS